MLPVEGNLKILFVFGTRPEAIKLAPVIRKFQDSGGGGIATAVCVTAQHRELLDGVLALFGIAPDYDLDVMTENQSPAQVAAKIIGSLGPVFTLEHPDWVVVQGDTVTAAVAALAAFYSRSRVAHVEAGLRSGNKWQPFPEEINRRIAGVIADLHFAPTESARRNLLSEGVLDAKIKVTGNPVIDALQWVSGLATSPEALRILKALGIRAQESGSNPDPRLIIVTAHRRENFGEPLAEIFAALKNIAAHYGDDIRILYPVHPNPNVHEPAHRLLSEIPNITLTEPLDYATMVHLMKHAHLILTDSGGLQEEGASLGRPVLVLRQTTERPEGVESGTVCLVGTDRMDITRAVCRLIDNRDAYRQMAFAVNPYGDGHAAERMLAAFLEIDHGRPDVKVALK